MKESKGFERNITKQGRSSIIVY